MVKEKVLTGRYKDCSIIYDHIKNTNGEDIYFNSFSVMSLKPADQSKVDYWGDSSLRVDGAMSRDTEKDRRLISVEWRNGETSLLQVNTKTYNRIMESLFGQVPHEQVKGDTGKTVEKKSYKAAILIAIILICIILKFTVFN